MPRRFRFGICTDQGMDWETTVKLWQLFEKLGWAETRVAARFWMITLVGTALAWAIKTGTR